MISRTRFPGIVCNGSTVWQFRLAGERGMLVVDKKITE